MFDQILTSLQQAIPQAKAVAHRPPEGGVGDSAILVEAGSLFQVMEWLKQHSFAQFPIFPVLQTISAVDYVEHLELNYFLSSFNLQQYCDLNIKVKLTDRLHPSVSTLCPLFAAANFLERECFDLFGIHFEGHPDLRRILCPDDWQGYPLRKDYVPAKFYQGIELFPEAKMNMEEREFIVTSKEQQDQLIQRSLAKGL